MLELTSPFWILRKAFAWTGGGLRCNEMHQLKIGSLESSSCG
jgi:hypothetical protein